MKIMLINSLYPPYVIGGAERVTQALAEGLAQRGHQVSVVCLASEGQARTEQYRGVTVHRLKLSNLYWPFGSERPGAARRLLWHARDTHNPAMARAVGAVMDQERPEVVHTHNLAGLSTAVWGAVRARGVRLVHTLHDYYLLCPKATMYKNSRNCETQCPDCRVFSEGRKRATTQVDAVVGVSQFILDRHLSYGCFRPAQAEVVHNAWTRGELPQPAPRQRTGPLRLGFLGRLSEEKGFELLLQAMRQLPPDQVSLLVAGKGTAEFEARMRSEYPLNNVEYLGFVQPNELYKQIDVLVVPSLWNEPFGNVVFESYFYGIPVIGSNLGGIPEQIQPDLTGWIIETSTIELSSKINMILSSIISTQMRSFLSEYLKYFLPERLLKQYEHVYR